MTSTAVTRPAAAGSLPSPQEQRPTAAPPTVVGRRLRVQYGEQVALNNVDLDVRPGEVVALLGHSGSGKSTLMKTLTGITPFTADALDVAGRDVLRQSPAGLRELRADVGHVFQHFNLVPRLSALTNVLTGGLHDSGPINHGRISYRQSVESTFACCWLYFFNETRNLVCMHHTCHQGTVNKESTFTHRHLSSLKNET